MKKQVTKHRLLLEEIHEFKSLESSDSEQHNREVRETRRGRAGQGSQDKDTHRKRKLAGTKARQSFLSSNQIFNIFILCIEPITLFLDFQASTHYDVLNADLLLLHQRITKSLNADSLLFPNASLVCAFGAELRSCCIFRDRLLIFSSRKSQLSSVFGNVDL